MDSITHVFFGGAIAQATVGPYFRRCHLGSAIPFFLGALAATLPDFDVFVRTADTVADHAVHRSFMHSLCLTPIVAFLAALPFVTNRPLNPHWRPILAAAFLATLSHPLLDALTSYGTQLFWPFSHQRVSLDIIAVVDVAFTLPLIIGTIFTFTRRSPIPSRIAIAVSLFYLGFACLQHHRAAAAQRELISLRGHDHALNPRVLPQIGFVLNYRSIYIQDGRIYADAVRVPLFAAPRVKTGDSVPLVNTLPQDSTARNVEDFNTFRWFADGFVARDPQHPATYADLRYTASPSGLDSIWGILLQPDQPPRWNMLPRPHMASRLWTDLTHPRGYVPLPAVTLTPPG